nr:hypothetical protein [Tanacetum cinerariifolium]
MVDDDETSKDKEIDKLMALISLSNAGYKHQRLGNVAGARETVEQADWKDDTDDESDDQEVEAHYMYMAKLQQVSQDVDDYRTIFDKEPEQKIDQNNEDVDLAKEQMKNKLSAHQDTISILKQQKDTQIKLYKSQEDKELEKVIDLENKVKVLDNIVYKTDQTVQTMNMLNNKFRTSFVKPEYLKKAKQANPRLYDIGCYNDNLALMLSPESDEVIRLEKESRSKLSDLIRPFDYA